MKNNSVPGFPPGFPFCCSNMVSNLRINFLSKTQRLDKKNILQEAHMTIPIQSIACFIKQDVTLTNTTFLILSKKII
jgi:hypothetical protein